MQSLYDGTYPGKWRIKGWYHVTWVLTSSIIYYLSCDSITLLSNFCTPVPQGLPLCAYFTSLFKYMNVYHTLIWYHQHNHNQNQSALNAIFDNTGVTYSCFIFGAFDLIQLLPLSFCPSNLLPPLYCRILIILTRVSCFLLLYSLVIIQQCYTHLVFFLPSMFRFPELHYF